MESKNKDYSLFRPIGDSEILAFLKNDKILWRKKFDNMINFDLASDGSYVVVITQLSKKEMSSGYKSGGHIYLINQSGKILLNLRTPGDGLSCSISPDTKHFGITTMGPEWGAYYFDSKGKRLWNKCFTDDVGGIEVTNKEIILYDKIHKETRKRVLKLDKKGQTVK